MWEENLRTTCRGKVDDIEVTIPVTHNFESDAITALKDPVGCHACVFTIAVDQFYPAGKAYIPFPLGSSLVRSLGLRAGGLVIPVGGSGGVRGFEVITKIIYLGTLFY